MSNITIFFRRILGQNLLREFSPTPLHEADFCSTRTSSSHVDEVAEWLRRWTANPLGSARVGSNPIFVAPPHWFYGVMVSTLDFESSDPSSNLGRT